MNARKALLTTFMVNELTSCEINEHDEDIDDFVIQFLCNQSNVRESVPSVQQFYEGTVLQFTEVNFRKHFRLSKETFQEIVREIGPEIAKEERTKGKRPLTVEKQILICLWYVCNTTSMREIALLFGLSTSTVFECINSVCGALCTIRSRVIAWPDADRQEAISQNFELESRIPGLVGAIDGTHIALNGIPEGDVDYINRKGYPSLQLQVVVDDLRLFTDTYVGWLGSTHDARVFRNSTFCEAAENGRSILPNGFIIGKFRFVSLYIQPFYN